MGEVVRRAIARTLVAMLDLINGRVDAVAAHSAERLDDLERRVDQHDQTISTLILITTKR